MASKTARTVAAASAPSATKPEPPASLRSETLSSDSLLTATASSRLSDSLAPSALTAGNGGNNGGTNGGTNGGSYGRPAGAGLAAQAKAAEAKLSPTKMNTDEAKMAALTSFLSTHKMSVADVLRLCAGMLEEQEGLSRV